MADPSGFCIVLRTAFFPAIHVYLCTKSGRMKPPSSDSLMYRLCLFLFPLLLYAKHAAAQYEHLLHKSYAEKAQGIHAMYKDLIDIPDSLERAGRAEEIKRFARRHNDKRLERNVDFFLVFWNAFYQNQPREISRQKLTELLELNTRKPDKDRNRQKDATLVCKLK